MWSGKAFAMFLDECHSTAEYLSALQPEFTEAQRAELIQLVHRLRGSAGFFGQKELQNECKLLELELKAGRQGSELIPMIQGVRDRARHAAQQAQAT